MDGLGHLRLGAWLTQAVPVQAGVREAEAEEQRPFLLEFPEVTILGPRSSKRKSAPEVVL